MSQALDKAIAKLEENLAKAKAKKAAFDSLTPVEKMATEIHELTCFADHTDRCGWLYESWASPGATRKTYLDRAGKLIAADYTLGQITQILNILRSY